MNNEPEIKISFSEDFPIDSFPEEIIINEKLSSGAWLAPVAAIEGYEEIWENWQNYKVLPWNYIDDEGRPIPEPKFIPTK